MLITTLLFMMVAMLNIYAQRANKPLPRLKATTKPLIMILLAVLYIQSSTVVQKLVILAFFFGWLGDLSLMVHINKNNGLPHKALKINSSTPMAFGLLFFLCGHITYFIVFTSLISEFKVYTLIIYILYFTFALMILRVLEDNRPDVPLKLKIPVIIYMIGITGMSFAALLSFISADSLQRGIGFIGTLFFIASDATLVLKAFADKKQEKEKEKSPVNDIRIDVDVEIDIKIEVVDEHQSVNIKEELIMGTYIVAQSLIMISLVH